jgi:c-di-GMP-binding flagellar brake protein YcgR
MKEKRAHKRYSAAYCLEAIKENPGELVYLEDISKGGAAFRTKEGFKEEQGLNLRVFLKNKMFELKAVVVYVKAAAEHFYSVGTRFTSVPPGFHGTFQQEIEEIIERQKYSPSEEADNEVFRKASVEYQKRRIF